MRSRRRFRLPSPASMALVLVLLNGCSSWRTHSQGPESLLARRYAPTRIEVATREGGTFKIRQPQIVGDSLLGIHKDTTAAVALADVARVKHRRLSWWKTSLAFLGFTFVAVGVGVGLTMN